MSSTLNNNNLPHYHYDSHHLFSDYIGMCLRNFINMTLAATAIKIIFESHTNTPGILGPKQ